MSKDNELQGICRELFGPFHVLFPSLDRVGRAKPVSTGETVNPGRGPGTETAMDTQAPGTFPRIPARSYHPKKFSEKPREQE